MDFEERADQITQRMRSVPKEELLNTWVEEVLKLSKEKTEFSEKEISQLACMIAGMSLDVGYNQKNVEMVVHMPLSIEKMRLRPECEVEPINSIMFAAKVAMNGLLLGLIQTGFIEVE